MWNPNYHYPYYKGVPIVPGAVPLDERKKDPIKREKRIMAKLSESPDASSPYRVEDSDVTSPKYLGYPNALKPIGDSSVIKRPWSGYHGGYPYGYGGYGYGGYPYGYGGGYGRGL